jgi:hypothetical protein
MKFHVTGFQTLHKKSRDLAQSQQKIKRDELMFLDMCDTPFSQVLLFLSSTIIPNDSKNLFAILHFAEINEILQRANFVK